MQVSNQVLNKYFAQNFKKRAAAYQVDNLKAEVLKEAEKQKGIEDFIKKQLMLEADAFISRKRKTHKSKLQGYEETLEYDPMRYSHVQERQHITSSQVNKRKSIFRVRNMQNKLKKQVKVAYKDQI